MLTSLQVIWALPYLIDPDSHCANLRTYAVSFWSNPQVARNTLDFFHLCTVHNQCTAEFSWPVTFVVNTYQLICLKGQTILEETSEGWLGPPQSNEECLKNPILWTNLNLDVWSSPNYPSYQKDKKMVETKKLRTTGGTKKCTVNSGYRLQPILPTF